MLTLIFHAVLATDDAAAAQLLWRLDYSQMLVLRQAVLDLNLLIEEELDRRCIDTDSQLVEMDDL